MPFLLWAMHKLILRCMSVAWQLWDSAKFSIKFVVFFFLFFFGLIIKSLSSSNRINVGQRSETNTLTDRFCTFQLWLVKFPGCLCTYSRLENFLTNNLVNSLQWAGKGGCEKLHVLSSTEDVEKKKKRKTRIMKWLFHRAPHLRIYIIPIRLCQREIGMWPLGII